MTSNQRGDPLRCIEPGEEADAIGWRNTEIVRLRAEVERLRAEHTRLLRLSGEIAIERDRLRDELLRTMTQEAQDMGMYAPPDGDPNWSAFKRAASVAPAERKP